MKIIWNPNPLLTVVELNEADKQLLWHRVKINELEERISQAHFDLDPEMREWRQSIGKGRSPEEWITEAQRSLDYSYVCGDTKYDGSSFDEYITYVTNEYIQELSRAHCGDCTCVACSCLKCHIETLLGIDTIKGLHKHEASFISGAFMPKNGATPTLEQAIAYLKDYQPQNVQEWGLPHVERWKQEAQRAYQWLVAYQQEHFEKRGGNTVTDACLHVGACPVGCTCWCDTCVLAKHFARLTIRRQDGVEVAVLERRNDGTIVIVRSTDRVRPDLERWLKRGLSKFVETPGDKRPHKTTADDPELLNIIAEHFSNYGFVCSFDEDMFESEAISLATDMDLREELRRHRYLMESALSYIDRYVPDLAGARNVLISQMEDALISKYDEGEWDDHEDYRSLATLKETK